MNNHGVFKRFKERLSNNSPGLTVAVVALVFALAGGAFAAGGGLTAKQKKQVKAIAKAEAGKVPGVPGPPGAVGPAGPVGPAGAAGSIGPQGPAGPDGADGIDGEDGTDGTNGTNGQDAGFNYLFSTDTAETDPGASKLKLNNATPASATVINISETDNNASLIDNVIAGWLTGPGTKGTLMIRKVGTPGSFAEYTVKGGTACAAAPANPAVCGSIDEGTYRKVNVTYVQGNGTLSENAPVTIAYFASGTTALVSSATETGAWAVAGTEADEAGIRVPISFSIPWSNNGSGAGFVHWAKDADFSTFCKGTTSIPAPEPGHLCIYVSNEGGPTGLINTTLEGITKVSEFGVGNGFSRTGAMLIFSKPTGEAHGSGVWAVRAP